MLPVTYSPLFTWSLLLTVSICLLLINTCASEYIYCWYNTFLPKLFNLKSWMKSVCMCITLYLAHQNESLKDKAVINKPKSLFLCKLAPYCQHICSHGCWCGIINPLNTNFKHGHRPVCVTAFGSTHKRSYVLCLCHVWEFSRRSANILRVTAWVIVRVPELSWKNSHICVSFPCTRKAVEWYLQYPWFHW